MRRTVIFVRPVGKVRCLLSDGRAVRVPVYPGILKHPTVKQLRRLLKDADVMRKYTMEALRIAPWSALREFPADWLLHCLPDARVRPTRARALVYLLS